MKVFISGPMSGKPNDNRAAFYKAQEELEKKGYSVWNPAWLAYPSDTEFTKDDMHIIDFAALRRCDAIYMLKGWKHSKGAQEECEYAIMRGLMIMYEGAHCWGNEPVFDQEFAYDEAIKNRTNYQLETIKENINDKYVEFKTVTRDLDFGLGVVSKRIDALEDEVEDIKKSIGTDNLKEQLDKDFDDVYEEFENTKDKVNDIEFGYINWSSKMSSAIDEMEKVKETVKGLNSLVATLGERNGVLSDKIESGIEENRHYRLSITEQLGTIRSRLKAIDNLENTNEVHWINIQGLDKKLDELIHNVAELEKDQVDINSKVAKKLDDYKEAYMHLDNADEALERRIKDLEDNRGALLEERWTEIQRLSKEIDALKDRPDFNYNGYRNDCEALDRKISHNQQRCNDLDDMIGNLISNYSRDIGGIKLKLSDDNKVINNTLNDLNIRLKAIEKRLSIKPFYAPTEDEKDD